MVSFWRSCTRNTQNLMEMLSLYKDNIIFQPMTTLLGNDEYRAVLWLVEMVIVLFCNMWFGPPILRRSDAFNCTFWNKWIFKTPLLHESNSQEIIQPWYIENFQYHQRPRSQKCIFHLWVSLWSKNITMASRHYVSKPH